MESFDLDYPEVPKKGRRKISKFKEAYDEESLERKKKLKKKHRKKRHDNSDF